MMITHYAAFTDQIKKIVSRTDPAAIAILYGSRATGKARKDSDWDVLILLDKPVVSFQDEQLFRHNLYDLELETGESISTFVYANKDWNTRLSVTPIYQAVKQNGIIL